MEEDMEGITAIPYQPIPEKATSQSLTNKAFPYTAKPMGVKRGGAAY